MEKSKGMERGKWMLYSILDKIILISETDIILNKDGTSKAVSLIWDIPNSKKIVLAPQDSIEI